MIAKIEVEMPRISVILTFLVFLFGAARNGLGPSGEMTVFNHGDEPQAEPNVTFGVLCHSLGTLLA